MYPHPEGMRMLFCLLANCGNVPSSSL
jgi:hypothetical protein